jgi:hypothetical protein
MEKSEQELNDERVTKELVECLFSLGLTQKTNNIKKAMANMRKLNIVVHKIGHHDAHEASGYYIYKDGVFVKYINDTLKEGDAIVCYSKTESE